MNVKEARAVLDKNVDGLRGSMIYELYEKSRFSKELFWEFYDCVVALAKDALESGRDFETARKITYAYEWLLHEMIFHFDKNDLSEIGDVPENYGDYIERLDDAVDAYYRGVFVDEELYELQRDQ